MEPLLHDTPEALRFWQDQARRERARLFVSKVRDRAADEAFEGLGAALTRNTVLALRSAVHAARRIT